MGGRVEQQRLVRRCFAPWLDQSSHLCGRWPSLALPSGFLLLLRSSAPSETPYPPHCLPCSQVPAGGTGPVPPPPRSRRLPRWAAALRCAAQRCTGAVPTPGLGLLLQARRSTSWQQRVLRAAAQLPAMPLALLRCGALRSRLAGFVGYFCIASGIGLGCGVEIDTIPRCCCACDSCWWGVPPNWSWPVLAGQPSILQRSVFFSCCISLYTHCQLHSWRYSANPPFSPAPTGPHCSLPLRAPSPPAAGRASPAGPRWASCCPRWPPALPSCSPWSTSRTRWACRR